MKYGKRHGKNMILSSPATVVILFIILFFVAKSTWGMAEKVHLSNLKLDQAKSELARLNERQKELVSRVEYLSTDQGVEAELRTKYRGVKEGESVAVIVGEENASSTASKLQTANVLQIETDSISWWQKLLRVVGL
jgi:cell division protein FtsB